MCTAEKLDEKKAPAYVDIDVSPDGKTATVSSHTKSPLSMGAGPGPMEYFGSVEQKISLQIDLTGPKPVITDCKLTQDFAAA
jgi:hypothetical protein